MSFIGSGETVDGASKPPLQCNSKGILEQHIMKLAQLRTLKR
jgi:hypothetical protein